MSPTLPILKSTASNKNDRASVKLSRASLHRTIWLTRPDLRQLYADNPDQYWVWLATSGIHEYESLAEFELPLPEELLTQPAAEALPNVRPPLTRFMRSLWGVREDLQYTFDIRNSSEQQDFVWWYFIHGIKELNLHRHLTKDQINAINESDPQSPSTNFVSLTRLMVQLWHHRSDLREVFDLTNPDGIDAFLTWYFSVGLSEHNLEPTLTNEQKIKLLQPIAHGTVPRILWFIWSIDDRLQSEFPGPDNLAFREWACSSEAHDVYPILMHLFRPSEHRQRPTHFVRSPRSDVPYGVNLIGHARGQLGIGEDVRMAARALDCADVPFSVYNVEPGDEVSATDDDIVTRITNDLPYSINLFCTTGIETARIAAVEGSRLFDGRYTIGYWPWEFPEWPVDWHHAYDLVHEIWASSRFLYNAYIRTSPKSVRHMPLAVTVDQTAGLGRSAFGLPSDHFLFVFSFDFLSSLARKNPEACVKAFRKAFRNTSHRVGLVVKAMRATSDDPLWQNLMAEAEADGRIWVITSTLERAEILDLYRCCDCFVSLHRSEGFGRGPVEAMMLGTPVIVTGYSGNLDFTIPGTAGLVDYELRRVAHDEYPFAGGQIWADPDIAHAASWMQRMAYDKSERTRLLHAGETLTNMTYNPKNIGENYARRIRQIQRDIERS